MTMVHTVLARSHLVVVLVKLKKEGNKTIIAIHCTKGIYNDIALWLFKKYNKSTRIMLRQVSKWWLSKSVKYKKCENTINHQFH